MRANTPGKINERINKDIKKSVLHYADKPEYQIARRIDELDMEWDIERMLETNASILVSLGVILGFHRNKKWFLLS